MNDMMLPLGVDSFEKLREERLYYIDKTEFIAELLQQDYFEVNLITRPRRFGKTLTMSMLDSFFDIRKDNRQLFEGLAIAGYEELCGEWMNRWPVLFMTFKDIQDLTFDDAYVQLEETISDVCVEHSYLLQSDRVDKGDKEKFADLKAGRAERGVVQNGIFLLTRMMSAHYGKEVIFLIDEYDVPLAKANEHGYYRQMLNSIRGLFSKGLKTNRYLKFAVVTGCLRIAKESIFTGTNHFVTSSILGSHYKNIFGFTQEEVEKLLADAGLGEHAGEIRKWYDGYRVGGVEMYCPWDILNYVRDLRADAGAKPGNYWKSTSHNDIIRSFIGQKRFDVTAKFETLLSGGSVKVRVCDDLTYDLVHSSEENFWSILYLTGYLTAMEPGEAGTGDACGSGETYLRIPNEEVKTIFADTIVEWFRDNMQVSDRGPLMAALWDGEEQKASAMLTELLFQTISYHNYREDYYHAFLIGIFVGLGYETESDKEHGTGRPDIVVKDRAHRRVLLIEVKHSESPEGMEEDCQRAVNQIKMRQYARDYLYGYLSVVCYGAAFFQKQCLFRRIEMIDERHNFMSPK